MTIVTPSTVYTDAAKSKPTASGAARCTASDLLRWAGLGDQASEQTDRMPYTTRRVRADTALVHEGNPFEYLYFVCAGSFKSVQVDAEGYEQVLGFALHADMIGLDGMSRGRHASGAVALEDSTVASLPFTDIMTASRRMPAMERLIQRAVGAELLRRSDTQYLMSAASSEVRVARFLLHFAKRQNALGYSDRRIRLRMTRRDIASHLGVAHETVSRALTALQQVGGIVVTDRDIEIVDAKLLQEIQRVTRGTWKGALRQGGLSPVPVAASRLHA
jgi:CRP/FNR family transcriptional regulator, anaerobic regulatory protein